MNSLAHLDIRRQSRHYDTSSEEVHQLIEKLRHLSCKWVLVRSLRRANGVVVSVASASWTWTYLNAPLVSPVRSQDNTTVDLRSETQP